MPHHLPAGLLPGMPEEWGAPGAPCDLCGYPIGKAAFHVVENGQLFGEPVKVYTHQTCFRAYLRKPEA